MFLFRVQLIHRRISWCSAVAVVTAETEALAWKAFEIELEGSDWQVVEGSLGTFPPLKVLVEDTTCDG